MTSDTSTPAVSAADLPAEVRRRLGVRKPRRATLPMDEVRSYAIRVMHVLADLTPAERARVLRQAQKLNDV